MATLSKRLHPATDPHKLKKPHRITDPDVRLALIWCHHQKSVFANLCLNLIREIVDLLRPFQKIVDMGCNFMRFFDCRGNTWQPAISLKSAIPASVHSARWLVLSDGNVFYSGGLDEPRGLLRSNYIVERTGVVKQHTPMINGRAYHGLTQWKGLIMVFGGSSDPRDSEVFEPHAWQKLPPIPHSHILCCTCIYHDVIYICGYASKRIDGYMPISKIYISISTPCSVYSLYVARDQLTVQATESIVRYEVEGGKTVRRRVKPANKELMFPSCPPVVDEDRGLVYFVTQGQCHVYNSKKRFTQKIVK